MVWDGDFAIDKPATFRGAGQRGAVGPGARWARTGARCGRGTPHRGPRCPRHPAAAPSGTLCPQLSCTSAGHGGPAAASASRLTLASTAAGASRSTGASCGPTARPPRPTGCTRARRAPAAATLASPRSASPVSFRLPGTHESGLTLALSSCSADPPAHGAQGGGHSGHHRG